MRITPVTYAGRYGFVQAAVGTQAVTFLDVGNLGDGASTNLLNKELVEQHGGTYHGLDSNAELTEKLGLPNQAVGDIHHTDYTENTFDMLYLGEVIEHTWTPGQMVAECHRILKPGGKLVLDTPNPYRLSCLLNYIFRKRDGMGDNRRLVYEEARDAFSNLIDSGEALHQPQHKIFFTPAMMKQMLETHGFVVESIGFTKKSAGIGRLLLPLLPHLGAHLCVIARKATVDEAFADVSVPAAS